MIKKVFTVIMTALLIIAVYFFQVFVIDNKILFGIRPNFILITVIVVSLWYGFYTGTIYSFLIGFLTDIVFGSNYPVFTIAYLITGSIIGYLNYNYRKENKISLVYVTLLATFIFEIIRFVEYIMITASFVNIIFVLKQIIISSIFNIAIVYVIYSLIYNIIEKLNGNLSDSSY